MMAESSRFSLLADQFMIVHSIHATKPKMKRMTVFRSTVVLLLNRFSMPAVNSLHAMDPTTLDGSSALALKSSISRASDIQESQVNANSGVDKPEQHLVLIGGGHAHVQVIKALNKSSRPSHLRVTLIDALESASYSGMVPACVAGIYKPEETLIDLKALAEWSGLDFVNDRVVDIDLDGKCIHLESNPDSPILFDAVSVDIGSASRNLDEVEGARKNTIPTRPIHKLVRRMDEARKELTGPAKLVVIGGGAAGIELAFAVTSRWRKNEPDTTCTLLDSGEELLSHESVAARKKLKDTLDKKQVKVRHSCTVKEITEDEVVLNSGDHLAYTHCIWATGAGSQPLARKLQSTQGLAATECGWIEVHSTLQSTSHPYVFASGDCAHILAQNGSPPKAGVFAVRAGPILIENLTRFLDGRELTDYKPQDDFLKLVITGDREAMGFRFGLAMYGKWVFQLKDFIDKNFMNLFDVSNLPKPEKTKSYDTSQYDDSEAADAPPLPSSNDAAALLQRTDDEVDYVLARRILRAMADDGSYREKVLQSSSQLTETTRI